MNISKEQANLFRQWFNAVKDLNPKYLTSEDEILYSEITDFLNGGRSNA